VQGASNGVEIDPAAVVAADERDASAAAGDVEGDPPGWCLSRAPTLGFGLDPVRHGVSHRLHERPLHDPEHVRIEPHVAPGRDEHGLLADGARDVAGRPLERREQGARRLEAEPFGRVADLLRLALDLIDGGRQYALASDRARSDVESMRAASRASEGAS
jgi:hypothetical protein